jgi:hypothetical protein
MKTLLFLMLMCGSAMASVNVLSNGQNLGPAQDINVIGAETSGNGPVKTLNMNMLSGVTSLDAIRFDTSYVDPLHAEGQMHWDSDDKTAVIDMNVAGVHLQLGQEMYAYCTNKTGGTLANGTVVYQNGVQGFRPKIVKAQANSSATASPIGVLTHDVDDNGNAYVTTYGLVRGLNTIAYTEGAKLWLSAATAGLFTSAEPALPNLSVRVGTVLKSHVSEGIILVDILDTHSVVQNMEVDGVLYMGPATTDGSWRFTVTGSSSLEFQRRESGVWITKGKVEP